MEPRRFLRAVRGMGPYLVSHHPHCAPFRADVLLVRGRRVCIACFVGYPSLALGLVAGALALDALAAWTLLLLGAALALPQGLSFAGRVPSAGAQVAIKLALGLGIAALLLGVLRLPWDLPWRILGAIVLLAGMQALWVLRLHRIERTCASCPLLPMRPRCEGLADLDARVGPLLRGVGTMK